MKKIAIIGSGISGLVLGNLFKKKGLHFKIFEKKKELSINEGYGIQLSTNSIRILNTIGFMDFDKDKLFNPKKIIIKSLENQKEISNLNIDHFNISNEKYSCLKRSNLVKFLYTQVKKYVHFDHQILRLKKINEKQVEIEFNNNSEIFDYIIIASGLSFEFGKGIKEENDQNYFDGYYAVRGTSSVNLNLIDKSNINLFLGKNSHLVSYPLDKLKRINSIFVFRDKKENHKYFYKYRYSKEGFKFLNEKLQEKLFKFSDEYKHLFPSEGGYLKWWSLYQSKSFSNSNHESLIYIGDAFFKTLPTMAQGAGQAIESAYEINELFDIKGEFKNINYFKARKKRINLINRRIKFNNLIFHISNPVFIILRNFMIKLLSKNKFFLKFYLGKIYKN